MAETKDDGGPAFPLPAPLSETGMTLRDYFAIHAPEPTKDEVEREQSFDRNRNPHNDSYKPRLRERDEIRSFLRYRYADSMLAERSRK